MVHSVFNITALAWMKGKTTNKIGNVGPEQKFRRFGLFGLITYR